MIKAVIFDFNRTLYDPEKKKISDSTKKLIYRLKDSRIKMCLISANERKSLINDLSISDLFLFSIFTDNKSKEDFENAICQLKVSKEETIAVGDRIKSEIAAANKAGIRTVWLRKGKFADEFPDSIEEEPDCIINNLDELKRIIKEG